MFATGEKLNYSRSVRAVTDRYNEEFDDCHFVLQKCYRTITQMSGQIKDRERKLNLMHIDREVVKKGGTRFRIKCEVGGEKHLKN